jgi:hypothetical protein
MRFNLFSLVMFLSLLLTVTASAQVLGSCGSGEEAAGAAAGGADSNALVVQPIPLPGQQAIDFELPAVVGDEIKNIKLSDYDGKWRVLCFFPAAFTFV